TRHSAFFALATASVRGVQHRVGAHFFPIGSRMNSSADEPLRGKARAAAQQSSTPAISETRATETAAGASSPSSTSNQPPELEVNELGEFRLIRRLGRGGMSEVYLAEQLSLHRHVAVKVLRPELLSDPTIEKRFEQEAKAAAGLVHPNIVQVYMFGEQDG